MSERLTTTSVMATASEALLNAGYERVPDTKLSKWNLGTARLFEDQYGIVMLTVWDTWDALFGEWTSMQATLIELISAHVPRGEAKAWDGYLVLLTPSRVDLPTQREAEHIRYDTTHVRKIVATGAELVTLADVERAVDSLLPFPEGAERSEENVLKLLPDLLSETDVPRRALEAIVQAFIEGRPLMAALDELEDREEG